MDNWKQGVKDAIEVCEEWYAFYKKQKESAESKYYGDACYLCMKAIQNVQDSLKKLDEPEAKS